jgi:hypothetical protein
VGKGGRPPTRPFLSFDGKKPCLTCQNWLPCTSDYWYVNYGKLANVCKKCRSQQVSAWHHSVRLEVLTHYSRGIPQCACCGETTVAFLAIDHIDGGGNEHRAEIGTAANSFATWLRRNGFPEGYRVLCHNCNQAHGAFGYCPHTHYTPRLSPTDLAAIVARAEELERAAG